MRRTCLVLLCLLGNASFGHADVLELLPGKNLAGWKRVAILPDTKLADKNPWSIDAAGKVLVCDGVGIKEMLLYDKQLGDGVFHVEWRFRKAADDPIYNSGIYVRTAGDSSSWYQVQVAHNKKPPFMGDLFGIPPGGKQEIFATGLGPKHVKGPGEWNRYEITCKGKTINVSINGVKTLTWNDCPVPRGHVGLQAEFFYIEFKNLKFQELK
jgi:hypothetical protein